MVKTVSKVRELYKLQKWGEAAELGKQYLGKSEIDETERKELYLLVASALKQQKKRDEAIRLLEEAIKKYPEEPGYYHNLGNCYKSDEKKSDWVAISYYLKAQKLGLNSCNLAVSLARSFQGVSFPGLAYDVISEWFSSKKSNEQPSQEALLILLELASVLLEEDEANEICKWSLHYFGEMASNDMNGQGSIALYKAKMGETKEAIEWFERSKQTLEEKREELLYKKTNSVQLENIEQSFINSGWNLACTLLRQGEMGYGWNLYNYGLQSPASGLQRWQRALNKPFSYQQVPVWTGESVKNKRLLVLSEQAIGDTMMFLQLLPIVQKNCKNITLVVQKRLVPIYQRTYPEIEVICDESPDDLGNHSKYDFQIPCGSLPSLKMKEWIESGWENPKLVADADLVKKFSTKYRHDIKKDSSKLLIGISWSGGGKASRMRNKSLTNEQFLEVFKCFPNARFISLQYGRAEKTVHDWKTKGYDVIYDKDVDAMKDLDTWLAQVDACDLVISIANTTIHGAGGLQKPTLCLQSRNSDWRWIRGCPQSYWYKSVQTETQSKDGNWKEAIQSTKNWAHSISENKEKYAESYQTIKKFIKY